MISVDEARDAIWNALAPLDEEEAPLETAHGRILAAPVIAQLDQPPFCASAMDGYAVRLQDAAKTGDRLQVIGVSSAGERFDGALAPRAAVRIYTGAPVPDGADHILIQEEAERNQDEIVVTAAQDTAKHIRPAGIDFRKGEELLSAGARLTGASLALAAASGTARLAVRRRPRIALIANGDELVLPGAPPGPDQIICSIPYGLAPMIETWGGAASFLGIAADNIESIRRLAERGLEYNLIVPIGGASVGDRDYMRAAFAELGFSPMFEKIAMKPGKPTWFGMAGKTPVLGLPGNPASALVASVLFLKIAIGRFLALDRRRLEEATPAKSTAPLPPCGARETYLRARLASAADGSQTVASFDAQDSSLLSVMARSNVLIRRRAGAGPAKEGDVLDCLRI